MFNYGLSYNPNTTPGNNATNSVYLFNTLGYFWQNVFKDKDVLEGLVDGQVAAANQAYWQLIDLINSYSCYSIPIFDRQQWYPLVIYQSALDNNTLLFGEGVLFGAEVSSSPYVFGEPIPEETGWYSMILPTELVNVGMIVDRVITPGTTLVSGTNYYISNGRIFFNGNPFSIPNIQITKVYNTNGTPTGDEFITLWCYNASIDSDNLLYNIGYLFGMNVPHNESGKEILAQTVKLYTQGPTVQDIINVSTAFLGLPVIWETQTISGITTNSTSTIITTNLGTLTYPIGYTLKSGVTNGFVLTPGYIPVKAVDLFDNLIESNWWQTELGISVQTPNNRTYISASNSTTALTLTVNNNRALLPLELPPSMILINSQYSLIFNNTVEPVTMDTNGNIYFPVQGSPADVAAFQASVNNSEFLAILNTQLSPDLSLSQPINFINPVDFIFKCFMKSTTALLRLKFLTTDQLLAFQQYFPAIKEALPPQILLLILCDLSIGPEIMELNQALGDDTTVTNITITNCGSGYTVAPTVTISAPANGTTATATSTINSFGQVSSITLTNAGTGYLRTPTITIGAPGSGTTATATIQTSINTYAPMQQSNALVSFNSGSGLLIKDMLFSRTPIANPPTEQRSLFLDVPS